MTLRLATRIILSVDDDQLPVVAPYMAAAAAWVANHGMRALEPFELPLSDDGNVVLIGQRVESDTCVTLECRVVKLL